MCLLNIGDILNFTINSKHSEYCCIVSDVDLGVLNYCEYKTGKDLQAIKENVVIIHNWLVRLWLHFGVTKQFVTLNRQPRIEIECSAIANVIKALNFMLFMKIN